MLSRIALVFSLLIAAALLVPASADAKCARVYLQPYVATPTDAVLPIDGGAILIGLNGRQDGKEDMSVLPTSFTIVKGKKRIELELELIAPGFARAVPKEKPTAGKWTVEGVLSQFYNDKGDYDEATVTFAEGTVGDAPVAPAVKAAGTMTSKNWGRGRSRTEVHVDLKEAPPADAIFVVANWAEKPDASSGGALFVNAEDNKLLAFNTRGRCTSSPTGEAAPADGAKGIVRWVNAHGQVSTASKPFNVTAKDMDAQLMD